MGVVVLLLIGGLLLAGLSIRFGILIGKRLAVLVERDDEEAP